jgi:hypothetical protein
MVSLSFFFNRLLFFFSSSQERSMASFRVPPMVLVESMLSTHLLAHRYYWSRLETWSRHANLERLPTALAFYFRRLGFVQNLLALKFT